MAELFGKLIIDAIILNDFENLLRIFIENDYLDINKVTTLQGYMQYNWNSQPLIQYQGDTALHLALKMKRIYCACALLVLHARTDTVNASNESCNRICLTYTGQNIQLLQTNALSHILPHLKHIPNIPALQSLRKEALQLLHSSRDLLADNDFPAIDTDSECHNDSSSSLNQIIQAPNAFKLSSKSNLKYMRWREADLIIFSNVLLINTEHITTLILSSIHLNCTKLKIIIPSIINMKSLMYLDCSNNCIEDEGAILLAQHFRNRILERPVMTLILTGNRITVIGGRELILGLHHKCGHVSLIRNRIEAAVSTQELQKLADESGINLSI